MYVCKYDIFKGSYFKDRFGLIKINLGIEASGTCELARINDNVIN